MTAEILTASISTAGTLMVAIATYYFTKKREREVEWRKEKLGYYKAFVSSLSKALRSQESVEGLAECSRASNDLLLFAPQRVIDALRALNDGTASDRNRSQDRHDELLSKLLLEIRADLGLKPADDPGTFRVTLWSPAVKAARPVIDHGVPEFTAGDRGARGITADLSDAKTASPKTPITGATR
jgi:hypothetical protein